MKNKLLIILALAISFYSGFVFKTFIADQSPGDLNPQSLSGAPQKKATGVAGVFFKSKDPAKLKQWYKEHLGFDTDQYGARFEWREQEGAAPAKREVLQWTPFSEKTTYFAPSTKDFMINYRVENLDVLVEELKKENVTILDKIETYDFGKFIHIMDIEENKIELFEPNYNYVPPAAAAK